MIGNGNDDVSPGSGAPGEDPAANAEVARPPQSREQGPHPAQGPDGNRDASGARVCRFCGRALPVSRGPGNKSPYCQDGTTHGPKNLSCKQAWQALDNVWSLPGHEQLLQDRSLTELGNHLDRALSPIDQLGRSLTALRQELDAAVAEALAERDAAVQHAAEADSRATAAKQRAEQAVTARREAEEEASQAAADRAEADKRAESAARREQDAIAARHRAEAQRDAARDDKQRAEYQAQEALNRAVQAETQLNTVTDQNTNLENSVANLTEQLHTARSTADHAQTEADTASQREAQAEARLEGERAQHARTLQQARTEADETIERAREDAEARVKEAREEHTRATEAWAQELGELRERIGALGTEHIAAENRANEARSRLAEWQGHVAEVLADPNTTREALIERLESLVR